MLDPKFARFLEDSQQESDTDKYTDFDSSKVTKVLKVYLSKKESRVVTKCEQVPIYLLRDCRSDVFIDFMKKLIY